MKNLILVLCVSCFATPAIAAEPNAPYPDGYRDWQHVKSMVIEQGHPLFDAFGGIHHLYANAKAIDGYHRGIFPDGAVIVFDLLEAQRQDNALVEGERKVLGVMHKDAQKYAATGGWGFEGFAAGERRNPVVQGNSATACFACHTSEQGHDYVFSRLRK